MKRKRNQSDKKSRKGSHLRIETSVRRILSEMCLY